ncbi:Transcriptional regulatory protein BtsR [compost metagenome]
MKTTYNCVIIDDEPAPREILEKHIVLHPALILVKSFDEAPKALNYLRKNRPDIIFLDIEMPRLSGLELINSLDTEGLNFIFVTAHLQFATDAFDLDSVDYLRKPVSFERFSKSVKKALRRLESSKAETLMLNVGKAQIKVSIENIDWVESENYCITIYGRKFAEGRLTLRMPLYKLAELLPHDRFFRINQSVIVSLHYIEKLRNKEVKLRNGNKFMISDTYKWITGYIENRLKMQ